MIKEINIPRAIHLYSEGIEGLGFTQIKSFIKDNFGSIAVRLIKIKEETVVTEGLLFWFLGTQRNFKKLRYANAKDSCQIILTKKLFATFDPDKRPHIRAAIFGYPCIISTSGIVEGPAKPKEFYLYKQKYTQLGVWEAEEVKTKIKFKGRFIDYGDKRTNEVLKGYIAQSLFFYFTGEPFCQKRGCRLFNAHWQEDLIYSQIRIGKFCLRHSRLLRQIKETTKTPP